MTDDPKAPERIWLEKVTWPEGDVVTWEPKGATEYIRADLCASPLPPPGSEGEVAPMRWDDTTFKTFGNGMGAVIGHLRPPDPVLISSYAIYKETDGTFTAAGNGLEGYGRASAEDARATAQAHYEGLVRRFLRAALAPASGEARTQREGGDG